MRDLTITAALMLGLAAGCSQGTPPPAAAPAMAADPRPLIAEIATLAVTQTPGGAIVRATGLPPVQGHFDGALVPTASPAPGTLAFEFHVQPPPEPERVSTPRSREVTVAVFVTDRQLAGIREIRVAGARNARAVRR